MKLFKKARFRIHYEFRGTTEQGHQIGIRLKALNYKAWRMILDYNLNKLVERYFNSIVHSYLVAQEIKQFHSTVASLEQKLRQQQPESKP